MSLYHRIQRVKENPDTERAGAYWSPEEDIKLLQNIDADKALSEIALDHKRTSGSIEIRIRSLAYIDYKKKKDQSVSDSRNLIENISKNFRIPADELSIYIRDKEKYNKEKEEKNLEKSKKLEETRLLKDKERQIEKENKEREKKEAKELREKEKQEEQLKRQSEKEIKDKEKQEEKTYLEDETHNYIYCIKEREFIKSGANIFKVGRTNVHPFKRMKQYPNGSSIIMILKVDNCVLAEKELLKYLDDKFKHATVDGIKIGREYFEASEHEIIQHMFECLLKN